MAVIIALVLRTMVQWLPCLRPPDKADSQVYYSVAHVGPQQAASLRINGRLRLAYIT